MDAALVSCNPTTGILLISPSAALHMNLAKCGPQAALSRKLSLPCPFEEYFQVDLFSFTLFKAGHPIFEKQDVLAEK